MQKNNVYAIRSNYCLQQNTNTVKINTFLSSTSIIVTSYCRGCWSELSCINTHGNLIIEVMHGAVSDGIPVVAMVSSARGGDGGIGGGKFY